MRKKRRVACSLTANSPASRGHYNTDEKTKVDLGREVTHAALTGSPCKAVIEGDAQVVLSRVEKCRAGFVRVKAVVTDMFGCELVHGLPHRFQYLKALTSLAFSVQLYDGLKELMHRGWVFVKEPAHTYVKVVVAVLALVKQWAFPISAHVTDMHNGQFFHGPSIAQGVLCS
ncbi:MAG: hypothetical protein ACYTEQ_01610 [Planctomycetota bacterium]|jgi:hypothetical protein